MLALYLTNKRQIHGLPPYGAVDAIAPTQPGVLAWTAPVSGGGTISYAASTDAVGPVAYRYRIDGGAWIGNASALTFNVSGMSAGNHLFEVQAFDAVPNYSTIRSATFAVSVAGTARKPYIATPLVPTVFVQTLWVNSAAPGGGDGSQANPFNTVAQAQAAMAPGTRIYYKGTFDVSGNEYFGMSATSGTPSQPIMHCLWPGEIRVFFKLGGLPNAYDTVYFTGQSYHWFVNMALHPQTGADANLSVALYSGSHHNYFIGCDLENGNLRVRNSPDNEFWDGSIKTPNPAWKSNDVPNNSGSLFDVSSGSDRCRVMRMNCDGYSGHDAGLVGNVYAGSTPVYDVEVFDCFFRNKWAGGLQIVGGAVRCHAHWNRITEIATEASLTVNRPGSMDGCQLTAQELTFEFNEITLARQHGMRFSTHLFGGQQQLATNCKIRFNTIRGCQGAAIALTSGQETNPTTDMANNVFENNSLWGNNQWVLTGDANADWGMGGYYNGFFWPIVVDMYQNSGGTNGDPWPVGSLAGNVFRNNNAARSAADPKLILIVRNASNEYYTPAEFVAAFPQCSGNIQADPLYVSASDLHLGASSPNINAGYPTVGVPFAGAAPDIGRFEVGFTD